MVKPWRGCANSCCKHFNNQHNRHHDNNQRFNNEHDDNPAGGKRDSNDLALRLH